MELRLLLSSLRDGGDYFRLSGWVLKRGREQKKRSEWCDQSKENSTHCYWYWREDSRMSQEMCMVFARWKRQEMSFLWASKKEGRHLDFSPVRLRLLLPHAAVTWSMCAILGLHVCGDLLGQWGKKKENTPESKSRVLHSENRWTLRMFQHCLSWYVSFNHFN